MASLVAIHPGQQLQHAQPIQAQGYESAYPIKNVKRDPEFGGASCVQSILGIAYLVIGSLGVAGVLSGTVLGGCAIAFAVPYALASLSKLVKSDNGTKSCVYLFNIITQVALVVLGSLAITGVISPTVLGWCMIGPTLAALTLACCIGCVWAGCLAVVASTDPNGVAEAFSEILEQQNYG